MPVLPDQKPNSTNILWASIGRMSSTSSVVPLLLKKYHRDDSHEHPRNTTSVAENEPDSSSCYDKPQLTSKTVSAWDPLSKYLNFAAIQKVPVEQGSSEKEVSTYTSLPSLHPRSGSSRLTTSPYQADYHVEYPSLDNRRYRSLETSQETEPFLTYNPASSRNSNESAEYLLRLYKDYASSSRSLTSQTTDIRPDNVNNGRRSLYCTARKRSTAKSSTRVSQPSTKPETCALPSSTLFGLKMSPPGPATRKAASRDTETTTDLAQSSSNSNGKQLDLAFSLSTDELMKIVFPSSTASGEEEKLIARQKSVHRRDHSIGRTTTIDDIIGSYFQPSLGKVELNSQQTPRRKTSVKHRTLENKQSVRDLEKEAARRVFHARSDWRDSGKINAFLKDTKDLFDSKKHTVSA